MPVRLRVKNWQADFNVGTKRYRRGKFTDQATAEKWLRDAQEAVRAGKPVDGSDGDTTVAPTLQRLLERTYDKFWSGAKAGDIAKFNGQMCVDIMGASRSCADVSATALDTLVDELKRRGLAGGTINRKLAALSKMLTFAHSRGWIVRKPHIDRQKESEHRVRFLSADEETILLGYLERIGRLAMRDLVILLMDSGLRLAEAMRLTWQDVGARSIVVQSGKTAGSRRAVPQTCRVSTMLARRKEARDPVSDLVWHDLDYWAAEYAWRQAREALKMDHDPQYILHMLRHTFCSRLVQRGVQLLTVRDLAGHKSIQMTMRYAHLNSDNLRSAVDVLEPAHPLNPQLRIAQ